MTGPLCRSTVSRTSPWAFWVALALLRVSIPTEAAASTAAAITVEQSAYLASPAAEAPESVDTVVHLTCFRRGAAGGDTDHRGSCCASMQLALASVCGGEVSAASSAAAELATSLLHHRACRIGSGGGGGPSWETTCIDAAAPVPQAASEDEALSPLFYLSIWDRLELDGGREETKARPPLSASRYWQYSLSSAAWCDAAVSPFHLSEDCSASGSISTEVGSPSPPRPGVLASVASTVSMSGGMHRSHRHEIGLFIRLGSDALSGLDSNTAQLGLPVAANVTLLLPLSEGVFVDVDDALEDDGWCTVSSPRALGGGAGEEVRCRAHLANLPPGALVNIEHPSFTSPQHVLAVQVSFQSFLPSDILSGDDVNLEVRVALSSILHMRYQSPSRQGGSQRRRISVHVPSTHVGGGEVRVGSKIMQVQPRRGAEDVMILDIATGHDGDLEVVAAVTLLASIVGSLIMIRDASRVSLWC